MVIKTKIMFAFLVSCLLSAPMIVGQDAAEYPGTVVKKKGTTVTIQLDGSPRLNAGISVSIYKFFTKNILGMETTGWLHAAEARLVSLQGSVATVKVTEEKSRMVINNKKVEHLAQGAKVKLVRR